MNAMIDDLRFQREQHPLDADLEMFNKAADVMEKLFKMIDAVRFSEFSGIQVEHVDGQSWRDLRDELNEKCS
jgi:hypothetical protein